MGTLVLWVFAGFGCVALTFVILDLILMRHRHKWEVSAYDEIWSVESSRGRVVSREAKGALLVCGICNKARIVDRYPLPLPLPANSWAIEDLRERISIRRHDARVDVLIDRLAERIAARSLGIDDDESDDR